MTIETGGQVFKALKWTRCSDGALRSGPYTIRKCTAACGGFVLECAGRELSNHAAGTQGLRALKKVANDNARAALAFGPRPVKVLRDRGLDK